MVMKYFLLNLMESMFFVERFCKDKPVYYSVFICIIIGFLNYFAYKTDKDRELFIKETFNKYEKQIEKEMERKIKLQAEQKDRLKRLREENERLYKALSTDAWKKHT